MIVEHIDVFAIIHLLFLFLDYGIGPDDDGSSPRLDSICSLGNGCDAEVVGRSVHPEHITTDYCDRVVETVDFCSVPSHCVRVQEGLDRIIINPHVVLSREKPDKLGLGIFGRKQDC